MRNYCNSSVPAAGNGSIVGFVPVASTWSYTVQNVLFDVVKSAHGRVCKRICDCPSSVYSLMSCILHNNRSVVSSF